MNSSLAQKATSKPTTLRVLKSPLTSPSSSGWIINPTIDLLFCCGGLVWTLFLLHWFFIGATPDGNNPLVQALALLAVVGTHALSETHTAATLVRVYRSPESINQYSTYTKWAALTCGALALAGLFIEGLTPILAKVYLIWVVQHFTAQTYGLSLVYCYKRGYMLSGYEKRLLWLLMNLTAAFAVIRQFTYQQWNPDGFLGQRIPFWGPLPEWILTATLIALLCVAGLFARQVVRRAIAGGQLLPLPTALLVLTGMAIFLFDSGISSVIWLYVPAFYHGSQYLVLTTACYLKEKQLPAKMTSLGVASALLKSDGIRYQGLLFILGFFIFVGVPRFLEEFGFDYTLTFATIFSVINLHHFITDQAIWKLRDPQLRKVIIG